MILTDYFASEDRRGDAALEQPIYIRNVGRLDLAHFLRERGAQTGAEVGVYKGEYSALLCETIPGLSLWCVDRWAPYVNRKTGKRIFYSAIPAYGIAQTRLAPYRCTLVQSDSVNASALVTDGSLDFVYLDADHWYEAVVADLAAWVPKVKSGGIVAGHDYTEQLEEDNCVSVAVKGWTLTHGVAPWYVLGRPKVRRSEYRDPQRSWMWIVP